MIAVDLVLRDGGGWVHSPNRSSIGASWEAKEWVSVCDEPHLGDSARVAADAILRRKV